MDPAAPAAATGARRPLRLVQLQLQAFKSYGATPTTIKCASANGLTALVGKNGCGKSAVADAILWVLGETGSFIRTTATAHLVNRQCAASGAPICMFAKLCLQTDGGDTANNGDDDDPSAALLAAAQFFSVGKTYDGKKSTLRLETFADADFAQQPLSTTVITYGVLRKLLQSFGVDIKLTSRFIISQDAIGRTLSQKGSALLQHVERVIGTWQTYHDHTNQLKQVIADLSGKCVALFEDTHNKTADFGQLEDELQPVFQAFRQCQRAHSLGNDISTAAHEAVRAATASHEAHTRELNDARQAVTQLEAGVHSHSAALSTATDELAAAQQNKAGLKRSLSRVVKKIGALEGAILQHQEDRKRHTAQATVLGPRRLKKYAKTLCGLQAEHRRLTTEYTGAKQEAAALGADGGATSSATGPDHSPSPKKSRRRSSGGTTTSSSSGNGTGGGGAAAVGPVTELQIAMAELSVQTTEQQLSKLNSTARAAEQAAQANARHAQLQDKLRCVTSAALAEDGKLAQLQQELQQCVRLRDSLNDQIRQRRDAGGSSSAMLQLAVGHLSSSQRKRAHTNTSPRAAAVAAVTDNVSVFGSIAQVATCASLHAYVPLHLVLRHALLNDIVVEHRAAAICVSGHFRDQRIGRVTCHILNETARSSCAPAALAHRNTEALSHMADFVKCDAKFAGVISKLLGKWMYCASLDAALGYLRQHPTFSGSIATGCGALCFSGGREIRRFTAAQVSGILQSLFANQAALPLDNPPQLAASDESRSACACASSSRQSDRATNAHPDDLEGAVKACDLKQLQLLGVQRVTREQKARLDEEQRDLTASCAALEKQAESTECPAPLQKERTVAQRKRFVMQLAAQREHVQELREAWQAQLAQVPKAEQLREQCLELENALELNDFKQRDVFKKQRSTEETIVAATQAAARLQGQVVVAEASLGRQQALQEQYAASLDDAQLHIDASLEARDQLSADHRKQVAQLKSLSASVDTLDAESAKFTEMITAAKSTAARHRAHMQSLRRMHHKLQPAFQILSMPKPRKFVAINRIGVTSQDPDVDDGGSPLQDDRAAAAHDLVDKLDTFAEQLSACTRQASALMDHRLAQLVLCYSSIVDLRKQAATVSQRLQSNRRERSRLQAERFTVFKQAVDHVNDHLQGIFEQLCAFGSARLNIAIDSPDVFDLDDKTDVPLSFRCKPGRHCTWQSFHALSGGQKALCAVALTLALQRVYPCPFYVLDEIDSALDSVKVSNLARLLVRSTPLSPASAAQPRAFSSAALSAASSTASGSAEGSAAPAAPSQFIVLTHKAEMYEQAALIVGVFQREDADGRVDVQPVYLQPSGGGGGGAAPGAPSATPSDAPLARDQPCSR